MIIKCESTMLTFAKTKNMRLPDSVHNAGVTLQSLDIPHTLPSPIFYEPLRSEYYFLGILFYVNELNLNLSLFDTMLNFVENLLENERDPDQDQ
jgi:hypothetical protein